MKQISFLEETDLREKIRPGCPIPPNWPPKPNWFDLVIVAFSNGKDSRVLLHEATLDFPKRKIVVVYNLLGNEHPDSPQQAKETADHYGLPLIYTWKDKDNKSQFGERIPQAILNLYSHDLYGGLVLPQEGDDLVVKLAKDRGKWPGGGAPLCTSTGKRDVTDVFLKSDLVLRLAMDRGQWPGQGLPYCTDRGKIQPSDKYLRSKQEQKILILTGERRDESNSRAKKDEWYIRNQAPTKGRLILGRRSLLDWTENDIWHYLAHHRIPVPASYHQGFGRHSCIHCIWKSRAEMILAFIQYPIPSARRVLAEREMGHSVNLGRYRFEGKEGYEGIWQFVYGDQDPAFPGQAEVLPRAYEVLTNNSLFTIPDGIRRLA